MTEFEAHKMSKDVLDRLLPADRATLLNRLEIGKLDMVEFLGIKIDGVPFDEEPKPDPEGMVMTFNAADAAGLIKKVLSFGIGDPSWPLSKYICHLIRTGMEASGVELDQEPEPMIEFPKS